MAGETVDLTFAVSKVAPDQQLVFGWASISAIDGVDVIDKQDDIVPIEELERAAYDFVLFSRDMGDMHRKRSVGRLIESAVFTPAKAALGIVAKDENGAPITGWWCGFRVDDAEVWEAHREGRRPEFSVGGRATASPVVKREGTEMSNDITIAKVVAAFDPPRAAGMLKSGAASGVFTRAELTAFLDERVEQLRKKGEPFDRAFARCTAGESGRGEDLIATELRLVTKRMPGLDHHQQSAFDAHHLLTKGAATQAQRVPYDPQFPNTTRAPADQSETPLGSLQLMADAVRRGQPEITTEQAFAQAAATPAGVALMRADKQQRFGPGY